MITVMARAAVRPDQVEEVARMLRDVCAQSRKEAGCLGYNVYQDASDPTRFSTVEDWADPAAVDTHMAMPYVVALLAKLPDMVTAAPEIVSYNKLT
jgi:quinol monooxygenase YgiN